MHDDTLQTRTLSSSFCDALFPISGGTYTTAPRKTSANNCDDCTDGYYCEAGKGPAPCLTGHYCTLVCYTAPWALPCGTLLYFGMLYCPLGPVLREISVFWYVILPPGPCIAGHFYFLVCYTAPWALYCGKFLFFGMLYCPLGPVLPDISIFWYVLLPPVPCIAGNFCFLVYYTAPWALYCGTFLFFGMLYCPLP